VLVINGSNSSRWLSLEFFMCKSILLLLVASVLTSCVNSRRAPMEVDRDRAKVLATVIRFWQAYERKDLAALSNMLTTADDFTFFGSDAAEVVKTRPEWEELMRNDWQLFETIRFGQPSDMEDPWGADNQADRIL